MKYSMIILFSLFTSSASAEVTFQCPAPDSIKQITIPHSFNCAYTATSDGIGFGGFNNCGLVGLPFVGGNISEVNGYWSLNCGYSNGSSSNAMSVGPDPVIAMCAFANATRTCTGSLSTCTITCPSAPSIAGNSDSSNSKTSD